MCRYHTRVKSILRYRCASVWEEMMTSVYYNIVGGWWIIQNTLWWKNVYKHTLIVFATKHISWTRKKKRAPRSIPLYYACKYYYHLLFNLDFARTQVYDIEPLAKRLLRSILDDAWCTDIILCLRCLQNDELEMVHKAWRSTEEMLYCFFRSSIQFQGHPGWKNRRFESNLSEITRPVAAIKSLRFALFQVKYIWNINMYTIYKNKHKKHSYIS